MLVPSTELGPSARQMQVGFYRLCELRKVNMPSHVYWHCWREADKRAEMTAKHALAPKAFAQQL